MALELAWYDLARVVVVHRYGCPTVSSVARQVQVEPIVRVRGPWEIQGCQWCKPAYGFVMAQRSQVKVRNDRVLPDRFLREDREERDRRVSLWPPRGVAALDVRPGVRDERWKARAGCRSDGRLGEWMKWLWLSDHKGRWANGVMKTLCAECPVRAECLEAGVWGEETWGVWGGATVGERRRLRKRWLKEGRTDGRSERSGYGAGGVPSAIRSRVAATG